MYRKARYNLNEKVIGTSLAGKEVIGQYRGLRSSFGALIFGNITGEVDPPALHPVLVLSIRTLGRETPPRIPIVKISIFAGDPCIGITKDNIKITGVYMNSAGPRYAWIRGWPTGANQLSPKQAYKIKKDTLRKTS